jgi:hypothetical protein
VLYSQHHPEIVQGVYIPVLIARVVDAIMLIEF